MNASNFGKICAYVMQEDILMDCLTPRESLIFGAKLKLKATNDQIRRRVDNLLRKVKLILIIFNKVWTRKMRRYLHRECNHQRNLRR